MAKVRIDLPDTLPEDVTGILIEYELGGAVYDVGRFAPSSSIEVSLPDAADALVVLVTPLAKRPAKTTRVLFNSQQLVEDKTVPVTPTPTVQANPLDNSLTVTVAGEDGVGYEIRTSDPDTDPEDAWVQGEAAPNAPKVIFAIEEPKQTVHIRAVREEDGAVGDWESVTVDTPETPQELVAVTDDTDLDDITIEPFLEIFDPAEIDGGELKFVEGAALSTLTGSPDGPTLADLTGVGGPLIEHMLGRFYPEARITSPVYEEAIAHDFLPRSLIRPTQYGYGDNTGDLDSWPLLFDMHPRLPAFRDTPFLYPHLNPLDTSGRGGDESGLVTVDEIALSDNTGEAPSSFNSIVPGHRYRAVKYQLAKTIKNPLGGRDFRIDRWKRQRLFRNRKHEFNTGNNPPYLGTPTPDRIQFTFPTPLELTAVTRATVTPVIAGKDADDGIQLICHVLSVDRDKIVFSVVQELWGDVTTDAVLRTATINFPRNFATGARIAVALTPIDASADAAAWMTSAPAVNSVAIKSTAISTVVHYQAIGAPSLVGVSFDVAVFGY